MKRVNIAAPEFKQDPDDPEGFRSGMARFGKQLGAKDTGATVYELPPGQALCPYHYEAGEEEWLLVLEGKPHVRTPEGTEQAESFDLIFFPKGPDGAHQVRNDTDAPVRVLMWSNVVYPQTSFYPDSDKVGVWPDADAKGALFLRSSAVEYFHGETS